MITYLNILIDLLLIFAVWRSNKKYVNDFLTVSLLQEWTKRRINKTEVGFHRRLSKLVGTREKNLRKVAIAEKFADRAFSMASTANLGVIALQKTLQTPRFMHKEQSQRNQLAKNEIEELYNGTGSNGSHDYLSSIPEFLTKDEQQIFDLIEEQRMKEASKLD